MKLQRAVAAFILAIFISSVNAQVPPAGGGNGGSAGGSVTGPGTSGTLAQAIQGIPNGVPVLVQVQSGGTGGGAVYGPDAVGAAPTKPPVLQGFLDSSGNVRTVSPSFPQPIAGTVTANLGTLNGAALDTSVQAVKTTLGSPFQAGGAIGNTAFGISGTLPAFAVTPTFNIGTAPTLTVQGTVGVTQSGGFQVSTTSSGPSYTPGGAANSSVLAGLTYLSTPPTLTNQFQSSLQGDAAGNLYVSLGRAGMTGPSVGPANALGVVQQDGISDTVSASAVGPFTGGTADPTTGSEIMAGFSSFSVQVSAVGTSPVVVFEGSNLCTTTATDWQTLEWKQIAGTGTYIGSTAVSLGSFYKFDVNYKCARIRLVSGSGTTTATIIRKIASVFPENLNSNLFIGGSAGGTSANPIIGQNGYYDGVTPTTFGAAGYGAIRLDSHGSTRTAEVGSDNPAVGITPATAFGATALQVKATQGNLYHMEVTNATATLGYVIEYNVATANAPAANSTLTNSLILGCHLLPASGVYDPARNSGPPKAFSAGILLLVSSTPCAGTTVTYTTGTVTAMIEGEAR